MQNSSETRPRPLIVAEINMVTSGSTGKIMLQIATCARERGHTVYTYSPASDDTANPMPPPPAGHRYYGTPRERWLHKLVGRVLGVNGHLSYRGTRKMIREMKKNGVELLHLHNLHDYCVHFPSLFRYIKKNNIRVIWTLHDCWTFTGHCAYFDAVNCEKWKTGCFDCPIHENYPRSRVDDSAFLYRKKKAWFTDVKDLTVVTPSNWLADLVKQSFLGEYPVKVIGNGIDLSVFRPTESAVRERYGCEGKFLLLGVASWWSKRKGMDVFRELSKRLPENYKIVLVGTLDRMEAPLPEEILHIPSTQNQRELAELYSAADLFVIPTYEDNYPTVNMEALACGTPVVTFRTGGSSESIDSTCGSVVERGDIDALEKEIVRVCMEHPYSKEACLAHAEAFDMYKCFGEYVELYEKTENQ